MIPNYLLQCWLARESAQYILLFTQDFLRIFSKQNSGCKAKIVITSDGAYRGAKLIPMKEITDKALVNCSESKN